MQSRVDRHWPFRIAGVLLIAGPLIWVMWPVIFGRQTFVFRDAGHFYYPLYEYVANEWRAGRMPLWNPYDNLGQPLLANVPSAVCYPGKIIFQLPFDYSLQYNVYILAHLLVAAATCYGCARGWAISRGGALLASLSYTFGGSLLSQHCNVIYLVGAAWMPLALWSGTQIWQGASFHLSLVWGVSAALMLLGGDPQAAYHAGMALVLFGVIKWWRHRRGIAALPDTRGTAAGWPRMKQSVGLATLAIGTALALSAVQILPSVEWARLSDRSDNARASTAWNLVASIAAPQGRSSENWYEGFVGVLPPGAHQEHAYQYSLGPWRFAELLWPNFGGCQYPIHRRWLNALPAEGRIWTPSIYIGLLPLVMAASTWAYRRTEANVQWLWALVILFGVASLGRYGVGWLIQEICYIASGGTRSGPPIGRPVGGVYWWMYILLPGYSVFRYPAKLFVVASLGLSLLAGYGWDGAQRQSHSIRRLLARICAVTLIALAAVLILGPQWDRFLAERVPPDAVFGIFDTQQGWWDLINALSQTLLLCGAYVAAIGVWFRPPSGNQSEDESRVDDLEPAPRKSIWYAKLIQYGLLSITAVELVYAHGWMVQFAANDSWRSPTTLESLSKEIERTLPGTRWFRPTNRSVYPADWRLGDGSQDRHSAALRWDRETIYPNFHLQYPLRQIGIRGAAMPGDLRELLLSMSLMSRQRPRIHENWLDALAVNEFLLLDESDRIPHAAKLQSLDFKAAPSQTVRWSTRLQPLERAWAAALDQVEWLAEDAMESPQTVGELLTHIHNSRSGEEGFRQRPFVMLRSKQSDLANHSEKPIVARPEAANHVRMIRDEPGWIELQADLSEACLIILADQYYPGWTLHVSTDGKGDSHPVPIHRTNLVMRGAVLPRGKHRLSFEFRPRSVAVGTCVSTLCWLGVAGWAGYVATKRRASPCIFTNIINCRVRATSLRRGRPTIRSQRGKP